MLILFPLFLNSLGAVHHFVDFLFDLFELLLLSDDILHVTKLFLKSVLHKPSFLVLEEIFELLLGLPVVDLLGKLDAPNVGSMH